MDHNKIVTFYFKKGSKGVQNSEILHIGKVYRIVLSKFGAVSFLELIVLRAYGNMTTYFFNLLWCPWQIAQKMANKCRIPKFELSFLLSNFNAFWVTFESIQKMSFFDFIDVQFHCIWCPWQIAQKMANKCRIPKFELSFYYLILMLFELPLNQYRKWASLILSMYSSTVLNNYHYF
jgi:hypothetical protein